MRDKLLALAFTIAALAAVAPAAAQTEQPAATTTTTGPATVGSDIDDEGFDYGWLGLLGLLGLAGLGGRRRDTVRHVDTVSTTRTDNRH